MTTISTLARGTLVVALILSSTGSFATTFKYRIPNPGLRITLYGQSSSGDSGGSGTTGGTAGNATNGGGGTTQPDTQSDPIYATSGVEFRQNGSVITQLNLGTSGTEYTLTLRNSSSEPLRGWLGNADGGLAIVDMSRSTCGQDTVAGQPTILAPGASCNFVLISNVPDWAKHPADVLSFKSLDYSPIPGYLSFPGANTMSAGDDSGPSL